MENQFGRGGSRMEREAASGSLLTTLNPAIYESAGSAPDDLTTMALQLFAVTLAPHLTGGHPQNSTYPHHHQSIGGGGSSSSPVATPNPPPSSGGSIAHMRLALTVTHLALVVLGTVNLLVVFVILLRPYMRSITNVYMLSLCLADFIYVGNLVLVAASQINEKSWPFSPFLCTMYHGTETTGKYASVMFVVLLAADRYCAMCRSQWCSRYRNYRTATIVSITAWMIAFISASPLYWFSDVILVNIKKTNLDHVTRLCIAKWPSSDTAHWYIIFSSIVIFVIPLVLIVFCYYHILNKLREALRSCKRMKRNSSSRAPYHRVTRLVLWVVVFHVICWTPFWLFNLFSSIFRLRISTQFDRVVINIIHLFPYVNCALNPLLYAVNAENFRHAFRSLFCRQKQRDLFEDSQFRMMLPGPTAFTSTMRAAGVKAGLDGAVMAHTRLTHKRGSPNNAAYPRVSSGTSLNNRTASSERLLLMSSNNSANHCGEKRGAMMGNGSPLASSSYTAPTSPNMSCAGNTQTSVVINGDALKREPANMNTRDQKKYRIQKGQKQSSKHSINSAFTAAVNSIVRRKNGIFNSSSKKSIACDTVMTTAEHTMNISVSVRGQEAGGDAESFGGGGGGEERSSSCSGVGVGGRAVSISPTIGSPPATPTAKISFCETASVSRKALANNAWLVQQQQLEQTTSIGKQRVDTMSKSSCSLGTTGGNGSGSEFDIIV